MRTRNVKLLEAARTQSSTDRTIWISRLQEHLSGTEMCQPEIMKLALVLKSLAKKHVIPPEANVEFLILGCLNAGKLGWMCQSSSKFSF